MPNPWDGWELWFIASLALAMIPVILVVLFWRRGDDCCKTKIVIFSILDLLVVVVAYLHYYLKLDVLILPVLGSASFAVPLILSFCDEYNLGTRLDNGEVRKGIAISFTVFYLILLSLFFFNVTLPQFSGNSSSGEAGKLLSTPMGAKAGDTGVLKVLNAVKANDPKVGNETKNKDTNNDTAGGTFPGQIPPYAVKDLLTNFIYVYVIIIGFYFGSRVFEDFAGAKMAKELKDVDPRDLLKKRYAMGEISHEDYLERISKLADSDPKDITELEIAFNKSKKVIRITNLGNQADAGAIKKLVIDGIIAVGKNKDGKPIEGTEMPKGNIDITIDKTTDDQLSPDKKSYAIRLITDTGRDMRKSVTLTDF